jgi:hypothetical protein
MDWMGLEKIEKKFDLFGIQTHPIPLNPHGLRANRTSLQQDLSRLFQEITPTKNCAIFFRQRVKHLPTGVDVQLHYGGVGSTKCCLTAISIFLLIASVEGEKGIEYASWFDIGQHTCPAHYGHIQS